MKKLICLVLSVCMLLTTGILTAFAAEDNETIIFADDFESYPDGADIVFKQNTLAQWSSGARSATSTVKAYNAGEDGMVLRITNTADKNGGPRAEKTLYLTSVKNLKFSFRLKTVNTDARVYAKMTDGKNMLVEQDTGGKWISYEFEFDFDKNTYNLYENGKLKQRKLPLEFTQRAEVVFGFEATVSAGKEILVDDVKLTTTDSVDLDAVGTGAIGVRTPEEILAMFDQTPAPKIAVPAGKFSFFEYDCSLNGNVSLPSGSDSSFTKVVSGEFIKPAEINKEKLVRVTNPRASQSSPRLEKSLTVGETPTDITVEFYAQLSKSGIFVQLDAQIDGTNKHLVHTDDIMVADVARQYKWSHVKLEFNLKDKTYSTYINGTAVETNAGFMNVPNEYMDVNLVIYSRLAPTDTVLYDNFIIYSSSAPAMGNAKYFGATGTNWELIGTEVKPESYIANLRQHPRLIINNRQAILDKIANDEKVATWYNNVKMNADLLLNSALVQYTFSNGRNILGEARTIEGRLHKLGMTYLVEQDRKYIERGLAEIRNAGTFPDWSNQAPIIPSELMFGIACFYDWTYNGLTPEERTEIIDIVKKQALWQFVRSYDGVISVEIANGTSNRTMVANACAAGVAIAFANEEPALCQFLFDEATDHAKQALAEYGEDGAFPEGSMYWSYATEYMTYLIAEIEAAVKDEYTLPDNLAWYYEQGQIKNTVDYWIYMSGAADKFNFGDANSGFSYYPLVYRMGERYNKPFYGWFLNRLAEINNRVVESPEFAVAWYNPDIEWKNTGMPLDKTFDAKDNAQTMSMRSSWSDEDALYVAMQGGDNQTGHMFKSLGTFVIDANGQRFIRTLGQSNYSSTYDADMYYQKRAEGQNTIIANPGKGIDQNPVAVAKFIKHAEAENEAFSILDMTSTNTAFADAKRGMYMTKGRNSVVLQDEIKTKTPSELWWFAHTDADITLSADKKSALLELKGERMYVAITSGPSDAVFEIKKAQPLPTSPIAPDEVYQDIFKLAIHMQNATDVRLAVEFVPLKDGEAAPEMLTPVTAMDAWMVSDNAISTARQAGDVVAMLIGSPNVLAKEKKTFVDEANPEIMPITQNGRTLVPVRFISESFGAQVGWVDATQTVTVKKDGKTITLQIGNNQMKVNDSIITLDVPAQTVGGRTLIPLRALVEALGKQVLWDDRGLIVISDYVVEYTEETKANIISLLAARVLLNGKDMLAFTTDKTNYYMLTDGDVPTVTLVSGAAVTQSGNSASFVIGDKTYTITFVADKFIGQTGTSSGDTIVALKLAAKDKPMGPSHVTWLPVKKVTFSVDNPKYPASGTVDNVIVQELTTNLQHRWTGDVDAWVCYEFEEAVNLYAFGLAGLFGDKRVYNFTGEVSMDGANWTKVLDTGTSGTTLMPDIFELGGVQAKYFRLTGKGGSAGTSNSYTEVRFYTSAAQLAEDKSYWPIYFAQNDAEGKAGTSAQIVFKGVNGNGAEVDIAGVTFTSDTPSVAVVDANGLVTFVAPGKATITATYDNGFGLITKKFIAECV